MKIPKTQFLFTHTNAWLLTELILFCSTPSNLSSQGIGDGNLDNKSDVNGSNGALNGGKSSMKSLKQREEEYAQARLRILGSTGAEMPTTESENK